MDIMTKSKINLSIDSKCSVVNANACLPRKKEYIEFNSLALFLWRKRFFFRKTQNKKNKKEESNEC